MYLYKYLNMGGRAQKERNGKRETTPRQHLGGTHSEKIRKQNTQNNKKK